MLDPNCLSIIIPTYKRPEQLLTALNSVVNETVDGLHIEIVIADNDPLASARETVEAYAATHIAKINYLHVPEPGVSNARNGALAVAKGRYILFLDDDMEARAPWAQYMIDAARAFEANVVFGPVEAVMPEANNPFYDYMQPLFCRKHESEDGLIPKGIGTGNCFIDRATTPLPSPAFNPNLNQTGGEDDALFRYLESEGTQFAWTNKARTFEHVPGHRATVGYVWRRNFAFGQAPTKEASYLGLHGFPHVIKWMAVGAVQIAIYGILWLVTKLRRKPEAIRYWGRLAQGVGKVLWSDRLSPKFYGI